MKVIVCVVTMNKSDEDIINLYKKMGIKDDALFSNQCGKIGHISLTIEGHNILIHNFNDVGVSNNRNHLLDNSYGDICINVDDDCVMLDDYENIITNFFRDHPKCNYVQFNGIWCKQNNRKVHNKKTKLVKKFNDVSYAGAPGFAYRTNIMNEIKLRYRTNLGIPNYVYNGEDSVFLYDLIKLDKKKSFYRSSDVIFGVAEDIDNSTYFSSVNEQYCYSKGAITKIIHPRLKYLYLFYYTYKVKHWRNCKLSYKMIFSNILKGIKAFKK